MPRDLHALPKLRDSLTFLYLEHAVIEQEALSIVAIQGADRIPVPIASMTVLLLGPGISITHAAVKAVCDNGCTIVWCGERAARFYAVGLGETRSAQNLLLQAHLCMKEDRHMEVVRRMYRRRFPEIDCEGMTLQQIRGMEGIRVREAYRQAARQYGVQWKGRDCKQENWEDADDLNRALSMANAVLYGLCQAAIVSLGF
ncbi:MAG: type I-E CRISPR-associated endonuclease Cas1e, partial [Clostridia bacterium]